MKVSDEEKKFFFSKKKINPRRTNPANHFYDIGYVAHNYGHIHLFANVCGVNVP